MADLDSLIGCKISLISHQDIRYDGTLFSINQSESSIVLKDVQVFGTEDRVTDKSKSIPPSTQVLPFVTFPGQEIKDLYVHEASSLPPAPAASAAAPPAAPKIEKRPNSSQQGSRGPSNNTHHNSSNSRPQQQQKREEQKPRAAPAETAPKRETAKASEVGTGGHLLKLRERKNGPGAVSAAPVETGSEFDFEEGLKTFKKEEVLAEVATDKEITKYTKDDFFDNFSKTTTGESKARLTAADERKLNQDTFGAIALQSGYRRGGRGGGRGRGGRGRGRGRGGYQGQSSSSANA